MKKLLFALIALFILALPVCASAEDVYITSLSGEVALHISPDDTSHVITVIPACSKVSVVEKENTWGKVIFRNKCGWINMSFTANSYKDAANSTGVDYVKNVTVNSETGNANLYSVASTLPLYGSSIKYTVPNQTVVSITRKTSLGWGLVSMNGKYAWIQMQNTDEFESFAEEELESFSIFYVYTLSDNGRGVDITSKKGGGEVLAAIPDCVKLTVRRKEGNYGYTSYDGKNGWINLSHTADSLSSAQANAGVEINKEYMVIGETDADVYNIPSSYAGDNGYKVGSVKPGERVFVLRRVESGWSLINADGEKGWIAPEFLSETEETVREPIKLCEPYYVYAATAEKKGLKLYTSPQIDARVICSVPECVKMQVITENGGFAYGICDYAAGWFEKDMTAGSYEEATNANLAEKPLYYKLKMDTTVRNLPTHSVFCGSCELAQVEEGMDFIVLKTVTTDKRKWGLVQVGDVKGWINLNCAKKTVSPFVYSIIILSIAAAVFALAGACAFAFRKIKKYYMKKSVDKKK